MNLKVSVGTLILGSLLCAPITAQAQRWWHPYRRPVIIEPIYVRDGEGWHVRALADQTERESNSMRHVFEVEFSHRDREQRDRLQVVKDAIQRLDESFERLRRYADDGRPNAGREEMREVVRRAIDVDDLIFRRRQVQDMIGRRWTDLRSDINRLARRYAIDELPRR